MRHLLEVVLQASDRGHVRCLVSVVDARDEVAVDLNAVLQSLVNRHQG